MHSRPAFHTASFVLRLGACVSLLAACSAASSEPDPVTRGGSSSTGSGGAVSGSYGGAQYGGAPSSNGGFVGTASGGATASSMGGAGTATSGGAATTGAGGAAATTSGGAGTTTSGGAATTGAGGAASGCDTYSGTLKTASVIFTSGFGKSTTGTWQGYAYAYKFGTATVTPGESTTMSCFPAKQVCAAGNVPADDKSGAGIGWNIGQPMGGVNTPAAITTPVKVTMTGAAAGMRVAISTAAGVEYCHTLTAGDATSAATGLTIPLASFVTECWGTTGMAYAGAAIQAIQVSVPGSTAGAAKPFDMCIVDIEPG